MKSENVLKITGIFYTSSTCIEFKILTYVMPSRLHIPTFRIILHGQTPSKMIYFCMLLIQITHQANIKPTKYKTLGLALTRFDINNANLIPETIFSNFTENF